jgi:hypothetical protein
MTAEVLFKTCNKCGTKLPLTEFAAHKGTRDGFNSQCKSCVREYSRQHYIKNREKKLQQNRSWYEANKEARNKQIAEYQRSRPERQKEIDRKSYQKNREKRIQKTKNWLKAHPEVHAFRTMCERTVNLGLLLDYQMEDWEIALRFFDHKCAYCDSKPKVLEKDHIVALSNKGPTIPSNIIPVCRSCNMNKKVKDLEVWFPEQSFFTQERLLKIKKYQLSIARKVKAI